MLNHPDTVDRYRNRAEELRMIAGSMKEPGSRKALEAWAKEYDQMANVAEQMGRPY